MSAPGIVVTRPMEQATLLADRIVSLGFETALFPLLEISPAADCRPLREAAKRLTHYGLVVFVSPNAVGAFMPYVTHWPVNVRMAVVGKGSLDRLAGFGITDANTEIVAPNDEDAMDSESLLKNLDPEMIPYRKVLIVRAQTGRDFLSTWFEKNGIEVHYLAAYRRLAAKMDRGRAAALEDLLDRPRYWVISSSESIPVLLALAGLIGQQHAAQVLNQTLVVTHRRIGACARARGFAKVIEATPGDDAVVNYFHRMSVALRAA